MKDSRMFQVWLMTLVVAFGGGVLTTYLGLLWTGGLA